MNGMKTKRMDGMNGMNGMDGMDGMKAKRENGRETGVRLPKKTQLSRRLFCAALSAALMLVCAPTAGAVKKSAGLSENKIIEIVGALEIMQGDETGNLNLDGGVTRAEFVKMAVSASTYRDDADVPVAYAVFPDVGAKHWAAGYIRTAVGAGWIKGYLDGTFQPSGGVKLEEAATIVLKLLGYTDADFIGSYPEGQLAKYRALKLDTGITAQPGDAMTRRDCMLLIYNLLCTETKNGTPYCLSVGAAADADGNIDYAALLADKKEGPYLVTDPAAWRENVGAGDGTVYYKEGKRISAEEIKAFDILYYAPAFSTVWVYDDKTAGTLEGYAPDQHAPQRVTVSGVDYPIAAGASGALADGALAVDSPVVLLLGENGCAVEAYAASEPAAVDDLTELSGYQPDDRIYRGDEEITLSGTGLDGRMLAYVSDTLSSVFLYDDDLTGVVSAVLPSKDAPASVSIGGRSCTLGQRAKNLFREGIVGENDFVTVYFGKGGSVEAVEKADIYDTDIYEDNGLTYESLVASTLKGPEIVSGDAWKSKLGFDAGEARYYADGREVTEDVIRDYDVIYYSPTFRTVWIYSDKVTGVLEQVRPNTVSPSSVVVAGSEYPIETSLAAISFSGKGTFAAGDTVTLLLGRNGVAAAVEPGLVSAEFLGLSTAVSRREYPGSDGKTYEDYYVTVASFDGKTHEIRTGNRNFPTGVLVSVRYADESKTMTVKEVSEKYTNVSALTGAIKAGKIAADAVLVDYYGVSYAVTYPARLSEISVSEKNVAYYHLNGDGMLDYLVLHDATGDMHSYGVILNFKGNYSFLTDARQNGITNYVKPILGPVQVKYGPIEADHITALAECSVTAIDGATVKYLGTDYRLWDYVECFVMEQRSYTVSRDSSEKRDEVITQTSLDYIKTLLSGDAYTVKGYYDETGTVRVLVAQKIF